MASIKTYLAESLAEMKKVTWPTREQTINYSLLVIGMSLSMAVFFTVIDYVLNKGISQLI